MVCYDDINVPTLHKDAKNLLGKLMVIGSGDGSAHEWCGQGNAISAELPLGFFRPVSGGPLEVGHFFVSNIELYPKARRYVCGQRQIKNKFFANAFFN